jgi:uracil-DNA glycosylase
MAAINEDSVRKIKETVHNCDLCKELDNTGGLFIDQKEIGLDYSYPKRFPIKILFVAESPPRPGNGFFYDDQNYPNHRFRNRLFSIINQADLGPVDSICKFTKKGYYLADAINCRWDKSLGRNLSRAVFKACSEHLSQQIRLFQPIFIVAMGRNAQNSIQIEPVQDTIQDVKIPSERIINISFPVVASNETDKNRVKSLRPITEYCKSLRNHTP